MRTLRLSLMGTAMVLLLGGMGGMVAAQDEETESTGRAVVTGTEMCRIIKMGTETRNPDEPGVLHFHDHVTSCRNETSDPRVSGVWSNTINEDCYWMAELGDPACVIWGTHVMEDDEGGWDCSYAGTDDLWGPNAGQVLSVCPGTGDYTGMTYVFHHVFGDDQDFGDGTDIHGIIYEGPPPAWGPVAEPPVE